jgi:hypothetical protein
MLPRLKFGGGERSGDAIAIHRAATALRVSEFDVFYLAHHDWFGRDAEHKEIEQVFLAYLFKSSVPHWVRHFCRRAVQGDVDVKALAPAPRRAAQGPGEQFAAFAVAAALAGMFLMAVLGGRGDGCIDGVPTLDADGNLTYTVPEDAGVPAC